MRPRRLTGASIEWSATDRKRGRRFPNGVRKSKVRLPYVGDPTFPEPILAPSPDNFKTNEHACSVCGASYAPFGAGYPNAIRWFCLQHTGEIMPEVLESIDKAKFREVKTRAIKAAAAWLEMHVAADNGDAAECKAQYARIRTFTVEVSDWLKQLQQ